MKKYLLSTLKGTVLGFILVFLTVKCSYLIPKEKSSELDYYVSEFFQDMNINRTSFDIGFIDKFHFPFPESVIGVCSGSVIFIEKPWFTKSSVILKRTLVYHELGHCVCKIIGHDDSKVNENGCEKSIMNTEIPYSGCLKWNWSRYLKDLRKKCRKNLDKSEFIL